MDVATQWIKEVVVEHIVIALCRDQQQRIVPVLGVLEASDYLGERAVHFLRPLTQIVGSADFERVGG